MFSIRRKQRHRVEPREVGRLAPGRKLDTDTTSKEQNNIQADNGHQWKIRSLPVQLHLSLLYKDQQRQSQVGLPRVSILEPWQHNGEDTCATQLYFSRRTSWRSSPSKNLNFCVMVAPLTMCYRSLLIYTVVYYLFTYLG